MSYKISNLYGSRVFSEHPLALWTLDDDFYFISLLSQEQKNVLNWDLENFEESELFLVPTGLPMENEIISNLTLSSASSSFFASASAEPINTVLDLDLDKKSLNINCYVFDFQGFVDFIEIGFIYNNEKFVSRYEITKNFFTQKWNQLSHTIELPEGDVNITPYINVLYADSGFESGEEYDLSINGISVGQWSENFNNRTTGFFPSDLELSQILSLISETSASAIKYKFADAYGFSDIDSGYYIIENNKMLSSTLNLPMIYGSNNLLKLESPQTEGLPSLIFPGKGFFNKSAKFLDLTAEFWLRGYTNYTEPIKIFGPLSSNDGIYVEKEYITLKIGPYTKSYFIGRWYRPILLHVRYSPSICSLLINGDKVLEFNIDEEEIETFPEIDQDFLGFYKDPNIEILEVDAFGIYPYIVPEEIAKKRFIYAQGVENSDTIASNFNGDSVNIDFAFAEYTSTIVYPDMNRWDAGFFDNLDADTNSLSFLNYEKPEVLFSEEIEETQFLKDNFDIQSGSNNFISMVPKEEYEEINSSIFFNSLNVISSPIKSILGVFMASENLTEEKETIFYFSNSFNLDRFEIYIDQEGIHYEFNGEEVVPRKEIPENCVFSVGFDVDQISKKYSKNILKFFSNIQNLSLNVAGYENSTFKGKIYNISFNNKFVTDKNITDVLGEDGFIETVRGCSLINNIGSYTLSFIKASNSIELDVGCFGYWEDTIPLSYFGKFVSDSSGNQYYDLDMLQFNIDYPSSILNNISENQESEETDLKVFITIQDISPGSPIQVGTVQYSNYINTISIGENRVLDFDNTLDVLRTKYEILDGTVIFPPKELINFEDYYITIHIEAVSRGTQTKPLRVKKMSLSSLAFDENDFYSISSPSGYKIYPTSRYGTTYSLKQKNPFTIQKNSAPYLYLTSESGINILPYPENKSFRGVSIPINQQKNLDYRLGAIQFWGFFNNFSTITENTIIGKIIIYNQLEDIYDIVLVPESDGKRAKLFFYYEGTEEENTSLAFYQDGLIIENPIIYPQTWTSILISFGESIVLDGIVGQFEILEGMRISNIAFYKKTLDIIGNTQSFKKWIELRQQTTWITWIDLNWIQTLEKIEQVTFTINGESIYNTYLGLSTVIADDSKQLFIDSDRVSLLTGVNWLQFAGRPV